MCKPQGEVIASRRKTPSNGFFVTYFRHFFSTCSQTLRVLKQRQNTICRSPFLFLPRLRYQSIPSTWLTHPLPSFPLRNQNELPLVVTYINQDDPPAPFPPFGGEGGRGRGGTLCNIPPFPPRPYEMPKQLPKKSNSSSSLSIAIFAPGIANPCKQELRLLCSIHIKL